MSNSFAAVANVKSTAPSASSLHSLNPDANHGGFLEPAFIETDFTQPLAEEVQGMQTGLLRSGPPYYAVSSSNNNRRSGDRGSFAPFPGHAKSFPADSRPRHVADQARYGSLDQQQLHQQQQLQQQRLQQQQQLQLQRQQQQQRLQQQQMQQQLGIVPTLPSRVPTLPNYGEALHNSNLNRQTPLSQGRVVSHGIRNSSPSMVIGSSDMRSTPPGMRNMSPGLMRASPGMRNLSPAIGSVGNQYRGVNPAAAAMSSSRAVRNNSSTIMSTGQVGRIPSQGRMNVSQSFRGVNPASMNGDPGRNNVTAGRPDVNPNLRTTTMRSSDGSIITVPIRKNIGSGGISIQHGDKSSVGRPSSVISNPGMSYVGPVASDYKSVNDNVTFTGSDGSVIKYPTREYRSAHSRDAQHGSRSTQPRVADMRTDVNKNMTSATMHVGQRNASSGRASSNSMISLDSTLGSYDDRRMTFGDVSCREDFDRILSATTSYGDRPPSVSQSHLPRTQIESDIRQSNQPNSYEYYKHLQTETPYSSERNRQMIQASKQKPLAPLHQGRSYSYELPQRASSASIVTTGVGNNRRHEHSQAASPSLSLHHSNPYDQPQRILPYYPHSNIKSELPSPPLQATGQSVFRVPTAAHASHSLSRLTSDRSEQHGFAPTVCVDYRIVKDDISPVDFSRSNSAARQYNEDEALDCSRKTHQLEPVKLAMDTRKSLTSDVMPSPENLSLSNIRPVESLSYDAFDVLNLKSEGMSFKVVIIPDSPRLPNVPVSFNTVIAVDDDNVTHPKSTLTNEHNDHSENVTKLDKINSGPNGVAAVKSLENVISNLSAARSSGNVQLSMIGNTNARVNGEERVYLTNSKAVVTVSSNENKTVDAQVIFGLPTGGSIESYATSDDSISGVILHMPEDVKDDNCDEHEFDVHMKTDDIQLPEDDKPEAQRRDSKVLDSILHLNIEGTGSKYLIVSRLYIRLTFSVMFSLM